MSSRLVEVHDAEQHLNELIDEAAEGTEIIWTDGRKPRARLVPIADPPTHRIPGLHAGSTTTTPDFDAPLPDGFWTGTP